MDWGLNFGREIARKQEIAAWNEAPKTYGGLAKYRTAYFGTLEGLEGITPSRHLELLPYVLPGVSYESSTEETKGRMRWYLMPFGPQIWCNPDLTADLTINTDFAQVEADQEQVNLTRFDLFFPEQRPFFLEAASIFVSGFHVRVPLGPPPVLLFYSRQIGACGRTRHPHSRRR